MRRKLLACAALLSVSVPLMAHAWSLGVRVQSAGGTASIQGGSAITSTTGTVFKNYTTTTGSKSVTVTAGGACSSISQVVKNGVPVVAPASPYTATFSLASAQQSLLAYFATSKTVVHPSKVGLGSISPAADSTYTCGAAPVADIVYTFTPGNGGTVTGITYNGGAKPALVTTATDPVTKAVKVTIPKASVVTVIGTNASYPIIATFSGTNPVANAGVPQTVAPSTLVTLTGSATDGVFSRWSSAGRPTGAAQPFAAGATNPVTFTPTVAGNYVFKYRVANSGSYAIAQTTVTVTTSIKNTVKNQCTNCHQSSGIAPTIFANWSGSLHNNGFDPALCANCHVGANAGAHPGADPKNACASCHTGPFGYADATSVLAADVAKCEGCHSTGNGVHSANTPTETSCIACHDVAIKHPGAKVFDNNGVRSITQEFTKWSHHVTGVALQDAHCAACHLEGEVVGGAIVPSALHMQDATTHLRNATTDADMVWDPATPNHTTMDNFCMSCHSATGFSSPKAAAIQALMVPAAGKTANAANPFGDTISNRYDKMQRPAVVNVDGQFDTTNNSHHAVKGARYSGKSRFPGSRQIGSPGTFANNSTATLIGARFTIYDAKLQDVSAKVGNREAFNALYSPLGTVVPPTAATELGDDSTLHCGDCHTVGQYKAAVATNAAGVVNTAVIGAHGSNNEYLLRNDKGTDERHAQDAYTVVAGVVTLNNPNAANLVCFNCHSYARYGSAFSATGTTGPHVGEYDASGRCNSQANTIPFNGYTTGTATDGTQFESRFAGPVTRYAGTAAFAPGFPLNAANAPTVAEINPDFGNVMGIQCANCHNSGAGNAYGGIHGSKNNQTLTGYTNDPSVPGGSYIDGAGNTTKIMRFLPGLGDAMHVPGTLGGVTGGTSVKFKNYSAYAFQLFSAAGGTGTAGRVIKGYLPATYFELPVRDNRPAALAGNKQKVGSYMFTTGGITNDTNWEQKGWKQTTGANSNTDANQQAAVGAGCYTLGSSADLTPGTRSYYQGTDSRFPARSQNNSSVNMPAVDPNIMDNLRGPSQGSVGSENDANPKLWENWGGCDDHGAPLGGGKYGFIKRIVRPVTY